jgi:hypothetical protein
MVKHFIPHDTGQHSRGNALESLHDILKSRTLRPSSFSASVLWSSAADDRGTASKLLYKFLRGRERFAALTIHEYLDTKQGVPRKGVKVTGSQLTS